MLFFFGTRSTEIKKRRLRNTICPHCQTPDSFEVTTRSKYFHFFWIPILPFSKSHEASCTHCLKVYQQWQFTEKMQAALRRENELNPAKNPVRTKIGCFILLIPLTLFIGLFFFSLIYHTTGDRYPDKAANIDPVRELINSDIDSLENGIMYLDPAAEAIKACIDRSLVSDIDKSNIAYLLRRNETDVLLLLHIDDIKKIKAGSREQLIPLLESCIESIDTDHEVTNKYIAVHGRYNMVLVKTPYDQDLGGRFAKAELLRPFYEKLKPKENFSDIKSLLDSIP